jgi:ElaB/YqjD/DUF883 family membrane-anchored ribosome-binding protein
METEMSEHAHPATSVREARRRAALARDIVDQHNSGLENRLARTFDIVRENPIASVAVAALTGLIVGRLVRR